MGSLRFIVSGRSVALMLLWGFGMIVLSLAGILGLDVLAPSGTDFATVRAIQYNIDTAMTATIIATFVAVIVAVVWTEKKTGFKALRESEDEPAQGVL